MQHKHVIVTDRTAPEVGSIEECVRMIEDLSSRKHSVYVHCKAGKGRSATVVACYLLKVCKLKHHKLLSTRIHAYAVCLYVRTYVHTYVSLHCVHSGRTYTYTKRSFKGWLCAFVLNEFTAEMIYSEYKQQRIKSLRTTTRRGNSKDDYAHSSWTNSLQKKFTPSTSSRELYILTFQGFDSYHLVLQS